MKRDMDLVRLILLRLEEEDIDFNRGPKLQAGEGILAFEEYSPEVIGYHLRIMLQAELVRGRPVGSDGVTMESFSGLMWKGHEFLDDVRDPKTWAATKKAAASAGAGSLSFLWEVAKSIGKVEIGRLLHISIS